MAFDIKAFSILFFQFILTAILNLSVFGLLYYVIYYVL